MDVWWLGPFLASVLLLAAAGVPKLTRPEDTVGALRSVGVRVPSPVVRAGAAAEIALVAIVLAVGGTLAAGAVAATYIGFAVFVMLALARGGAVASCGCFGRADTPPTWVHLAVNVTAAGVAVAATFGGWPGLVPALSGLPAAGAPLLLLAGAGAWLAGLALTRLAALSTAITGARA